MSITDDKGWNEVEHKAREFERCNYEIGRCSLGWVIRPKDKLDNSRWYFERKPDAQDHLTYLERTHP